MVRDVEYIGRACPLHRGRAAVRQAMAAGCWVPEGVSPGAV